MIYFVAICSFVALVASMTTLVYVLRIDVGVKAIQRFIKQMTTQQQVGDPLRDALMQRLEEVRNTGRKRSI